MSVITAVTAQNTCGVTAVQNIDCDIVEAQIAAVFDDIRVDAVKIGMVSQPEIIRTIAACLRRYQPRIIVVDPVMISKSGYPLLAPEACETLIKELLPLATLVTPNLPEAEAITGMQVTEKAQMRAVAEKIIALGAKAVLVKGGHLSDTADDLLFDGSTETWFPGKRIEEYAWHRLHALEQSGGEPGQGAGADGGSTRLQGLRYRSHRAWHRTGQRLRTDASFC